ncbi:MAG: dihydrodipicolinate synthase family protein [Bdellovibrionales bacterium]|nr:dihydrodipicolinate synthase family protein [Bdellovibrionales bacterium]
MTPFKSDGSIDWDSLLAMQAKLMAAGFSSVTWPGTMGNWTELTLRERIRGTKLLAKQGPLIVGTGALNSGDAAFYARAAREHGAAGLMIIPRIGYMQTVEEAQIHHFATVLEAGGPDLPAVAYNNPPSYIYSMSQAAFFRLRERFPQLQGFKESGGPQAMTRASRTITSDDGCFLVVGIDNAVVHGAIHCNAVGCITGIGNVLPEPVLMLWKLCQKAKEGDAIAWQLAEELERRLMPLSDYDADAKLVLYYKYLLYVTEQGPVYLNHRPDDFRLSMTEMDEAHYQLHLFERWWKNWNGRERFFG